MNSPIPFRRPSLGLAAALLGLGIASPADAAVAWRDLQFGGFASQGFLYSSDNDYLGDTSEGTWDFREYGLNASWSKGQWRVGAQVFGQELGEYGNDKLKLDWATVDYQPSQAFGLRAGRVKMPRGLYNEALDLDAVRPFVLLPQSVYDPRLRDFNASFDGLMVYGNLEAHGAGSFDYRLFYGDVPVGGDSGANDYFNSDRAMINLDIGMKSALGGALFWNTPIDGFRLGYSYSQFEELESLRNADGTPLGLHTKTADSYPRHLLSAEWVTGDWTFAAEWGHEKGEYLVNYLNRERRVTPSATMITYYVSAAYRVSPRIELGAYYDMYDEEDVVSSGTINKHQADHAISVRFDLNDNVLLKLEGHYYDGAGKIFDTLEHRRPQNQLEQSWTMVAAKVTTLF